MISISTAMDESKVDEAIDCIRNAVLAVHAEHPVPELSIA
jgi:hypothetical protein